MINRGKVEVKPIENGERTKDRGYFCIACGSVATQSALFKIEGATRRANPSIVLAHRFLPYLVTLCYIASVEIGFSSLASQT